MKPSEFTLCIVRLERLGLFLSFLQIQVKVSNFCIHKNAEQLFTALNISIRAAEQKWYFRKSGILTKEILTQGKIHHSGGIKHPQGVTAHSSRAPEALDQSLANVKDKLHLQLQLNA